MTTLKQLEAEIEQIKSRNLRVEADKAWETSTTRKTILTLFTYIAVAAYLHSIKVEDAWLHAIVPSIAFMLSTLTLPYIKKIWTKKQKRLL